MRSDDILIVFMNEINNWMLKNSNRCLNLHAKVISLQNLRLRTETLLHFLIELKIEYRL